MMTLHIIASGSTGNAYILDNGEHKLLLECGVRFDFIKKALDYDYGKVAACLVTHEHKDHCIAAEKVMRAGMDIYCSAGTGEAMNLHSHRLHTVKTGERFQIASFSLIPFETEHDAAEPIGWLIKDQISGEKVVFATDTYYIKYRFDAEHYLVECNYCEDILQENIIAGRIIPSLKDRIITSHFSLENVIKFLKASQTERMKTVTLLHLSDSNSDEKRMILEVQRELGPSVVVMAANPKMDAVVMGSCPY